MIIYIKFKIILKYNNKNVNNNLFKIKFNKK